MELKSVRLEIPEESTKLVSSTLNNGLSLTAKWIRDDILAKKEKKDG